MVATNIARTDVAVDQAAAVDVGQGVSQVVRGGGETAEAIFATGSGQMRQEIGPY
jgi:hypothetical protein